MLNKQIHNKIHAPHLRKVAVNSDGKHQKEYRHQSEDAARLQAIGPHVFLETD